MTDEEIMKKAVDTMLKAMDLQDDCSKHMLSASHEFTDGAKKVLDMMKCNIIMAIVMCFILAAIGLCRFTGC